MNMNKIEKSGEEAPSSMKLDPSIARKLFETGAFLIIGGVPRGTQFGMDLWSSNVGDDFRGVKMIPPGLHYVWTAAVEPFGDCAPRVGFAHFFQPKEIVVREWDHETEELRKRDSPQASDEVEKIRLHIKDLDRFLAAYDLRHLRGWYHLVSLVSANTLERCRPELEIVRVCSELQSCPDADRPRGGDSGPCPSLSTLAKLKLTANEEDLLPHLKPVPGTALRFTVIPPRIPKNCSPSEISQHAMDCIDACRSMFNSLAAAELILEEIQLSFAFFLVGLSFDAFTFWRKTLAILSHSEEAILLYREIYQKYCKILATQIPHLPVEILVASEHNVIYQDVGTLLVNLKMAGLRNVADTLIAKLSKSIGWRFEGLLDEDPDEQPVVVLLEDIN